MSNKFLSFSNEIENKTITNTSRDSSNKALIFKSEKKETSPIVAAEENTFETILKYALQNFKPYNVSNLPDIKNNNIMAPEEIIENIKEKMNNFNQISNENENNNLSLIFSQETLDNVKNQIFQIQELIKYLENNKNNENYYDLVNINPLMFLVENNKYKWLEQQIEKIKKNNEKKEKYKETIKVKTNINCGLGKETSLIIEKICKEEEDKKNELQNVLLKKKSLREDKLLSEKYCKNKEKVLNNLQKILNEEDISEDDNKFCKKCGDKIEKVSSLRSICFKCEKKYPRVKCLFCDKEMSQKTLLYEHNCAQMNLVKNKKEDEIIVTCPNCKNSYSKSYAKKHVKECLLNAHPFCSICNKTVLAKNIKSHNKLFHENKKRAKNNLHTRPVQCQFCYKKTKLKNKYNHLLNCRLFKLFLNNPQLHNKFFNKDSSNNIKLLKKENKSNIFLSIPKMELNYKPGLSFDLNGNKEFDYTEAKQLINPFIPEIKKPRTVNNALVGFIVKKIELGLIEAPKKEWTSFFDKLKQDLNKELKMRSIQDNKEDLEKAKLIFNSFEIDYQSKEIIKKLNNEKENIIKEIEETPNEKIELKLKLEKDLLLINKNLDKVMTSLSFLEMHETYNKSVSRGVEINFDNSIKYLKNEEKFNFNNIFDN